MRKNIRELCRVEKGSASPEREWGNPKSRGAGSSKSSGNVAEVSLFLSENVDPAKRGLFGKDASRIMFDRNVGAEKLRGNLR